MPYLTQSALENLGFARLGRDVRISDRAAIYQPERIEIGDHSRIDDFCVLSGRIVIGRNVHVAPMCILAGGEPGITLGDFSGLAYNVTVFAQSDDYSGRTMTNPTVPKAFKNETFAAVEIGAHSILGAGAVVTPGCILGEGTAVGAKALVNASCEPWGIHVGIPARRLRERSRALLDLERDYLASDR